MFGRPHCKSYPFLDIWITVLSRTKKTGIVDFVIVNSVMWAEGWERGGKGVKGVKGVKGAKAKGWGSCYQTGDQGGWDFVTTSKKPAL
jgi:hypothetical protein